MISNKYWLCFTGERTPVYNLDNEAMYENNTKTTLWSAICNDSIILSLFLQKGLVFFLSCFVCIRMNEIMRKYLFNLADLEKC